MRTETVQHRRRRFLIGAAFGLAIVLVKSLVFLPIDIADILYGIAILITLVISVGELLEVDFMLLEADPLDFVLGLLFPLDCYAVLILFGLPLPD